MAMNMKMKMITTSTLVAVVVVSGGIAFSSNNTVLAAANNKAVKDAPAREAGHKGGLNCKPDSVLAPPTSPTPSAGTTNGSNPGQAANSVVISGGFNTDPQDHGRPVVLIAAALGVPTEVFREAFRGVTPAGLDSGPSSEQAQQNKAALLKVLAPYGITNERLDEVSNYYRYNGRKSDTWQKTQATATAIVTNGIVTGVTITNPGAGYSSSPTITVTGPNGTFTATATLAYTKDFKTNGSISAITIK